MRARFRVSQAFPVAARRLFILTGEILDGNLSDGMAVRMTPAKGGAIEVPIRAFEDVRSSDPEVNLALTLGYESDAALAALNGMHFQAGDLVDLVEPAGLPAERPAPRPWWRFWS
jgi:hypothetical protein